jgi:hypothetical protein
MTGVKRRSLLKVSAAGAVAAASGGLAAIVAARRAPAFGATTALHWVKPPDFVPASDALLRNTLLPECEKALGIKVTLETIDGNGIQARTTSAIQSGAGPDIICEINNWAQLYADSVVDVSDVCEAIGKAQGGFYDTAKVTSYNGKAWIAVPFTILGVPLANRTSWFHHRQLPDRLGRLSRGRQEAQGEKPAVRPDAGAHLWRRADLLVSLSVVVGRQGGRGRRQDRRAEQQGDRRIGQIRGRVLEGLL